MTFDVRADRRDNLFFQATVTDIVQGYVKSKSKSQSNLAICE